jgi:hypothetical protein
MVLLPPCESGKFAELTIDVGRSTLDVAPMQGRNAIWYRIGASPNNLLSGIIYSSGTGGHAHSLPGIFNQSRASLHLYTIIAAIAVRLTSE